MGEIVLPPIVLTRPKLRYRKVDSLSRMPQALSTAFIRDLTKRHELTPIAAK